MFSECYSIKKSYVIFFNLENRAREHDELHKKTRQKAMPVINKNNTVNILAAITLNSNVN